MASTADALVALLPLATIAFLMVGRYWPATRAMPVAWIVAGGADPLEEAFGDVDLEPCEEVLLAVEVVVQGRLALRGLVGDVLHREVCVALGTQRAIGRAHDLLYRFLDHCLFETD